MSKPINVYAVPEIRKVLEEEIPSIFSKLGYKQSFTLIDSKLALGYSIIGVAAISFLIDKKMDWANSVEYQKALVGGYMVLCVVYWYFCKFIERGITYEGTNKSGKIQIKTKFEKYNPSIKVSIYKEHKSINTELAATSIFTEAGYLQRDLLFEWFKKEVKTFEQKKQ